MTLEQLRKINPPSNLDKLTQDDYKLLWISDYYDVPISGILQIGVSIYWFEMIQENKHKPKEDWFRRYAVVKLSTEQLEKEIKVHRDFQRYVGTHWDCVEIKDSPKFIEGQSKLFYDQHLIYCQTDNFNDNEVIGWFEK